jgi:ribosomal protein L24E
MSEKKMEIKKCGLCGVEIKDGNYITVWKKDKLVMTICKKCSERKDINERIRKMLA